MLAVRQRRMNLHQSYATLRQEFGRGYITAGPQKAQRSGQHNPTPVKPCHNTVLTIPGIHNSTPQQYITTAAHGRQPLHDNSMLTAHPQPTWCQAAPQSRCCRCASSAGTPGAPEQHRTYSINQGNNVRPEKLVPTASTRVQCNVRPEMARKWRKKAMEQCWGMAEGAMP